MDLLIRSRSVEKLTLYQEYRELEQSRRREWRTEKEILSWAADPARHKDLDSPLVVDAALGDRTIRASIPTDIDNPPQYVQNRFGNLKARGHASSKEGTPGIRFTREGLLLGEIINKFKEKPTAERWYKWSIGLFWLTLAMGAISVVVQGVSAFVQGAGAIWHVLGTIVRLTGRLVQFVNTHIPHS